MRVDLWNCWRAGVILAAVGVVGCGPRQPGVGDVRMAFRAPRAADCELQFMQVTPTEMMPGAPFGRGGTYEMIGAVPIGAAIGTDAMSEGIRQLEAAGVRHGWRGAVADGVWHWRHHEHVPRDF